ncbi:hypothetical protein [Streptomyces sp. STR69]|uniref:hypothetical protein n=1 Tax=Streptomyces sp. STR69 TaxID=1796942 RepID=UPI0021C5C889|nr:hypothetical protein [Streptomyces sp. STR69]
MNPRPVSCSFYIRTPAENGQFYYDRVNIGSPHADGKLHTSDVPQIGDLLHLWDTLKKQGGKYEVVARQWLHSSYGSTNWPVLEPQPTVGTLLELVVVPAEDIFRNQVLRPEEEDDDA